MNQTQEKTDIICYVCKNPIVKPNNFGTGYGCRMENHADKFDAEKAVKVCYQCCAKEDFANMLKTGKFTGYLTMETEVTDFMPSERIVKEGWRRYVKSSWGNRAKEFYARNIRVTNWPGSLTLPVYYMRVGSHNMANCRYDVWFEVANPDTNQLERWHGVCYGDNTQICHCTRTKKSINLPARLEYLRGQLRSERLSYDNIAELAYLAQFGFIPAEDTELLEAAGVPEHD